MQISHTGRFEPKFWNKCEAISCTACSSGSADTRGVCFLTLCCLWVRRYANFCRCVGRSWVPRQCRGPGSGCSLVEGTGVRVTCWPQMRRRRQPHGRWACIAPQASGCGRAHCVQVSVPCRLARLHSSAALPWGPGQVLEEGVAAEAAHSACQSQRAPTALGIASQRSWRVQERL